MSRSTGISGDHGGARLCRHRPVSGSCEADAHHSEGSRAFGPCSPRRSSGPRISLSATFAAVFCAKPGGLGFGVVRAGIAAATLAAIAMIVLSAWLAWRQWGFGTYDPPHDDPTPQDRTRFQGFATLLLSGLSFVAVLYVALPVLFIDGCASMRHASLFLGLFMLALVWLGPLSRMASSFAAHMLAHMGVVAIAAPLIAIGISVTGARRTAATLASALASLVELVVVWGWHAPAARFGRRARPSAPSEQASFLLPGCSSGCPPGARKARARPRAAGASRCC